jgi:hypothetical protein
MKVEADRKDAEIDALRADVQAAREMLKKYQHQYGPDEVFRCGACRKKRLIEQCDQDCEIANLLNRLERWA